MNKKIAVMGASIAGPALCFFLKRYGFDPVLIERNAGLRKGGYAIDIRGVAVQVAQKMGLYQQITQQRTSVRFVDHIDHEGKTKHREEGESFGFRDGDDVEIVRSELVDILMSSIPTVPCRFGTHATAIDQAEDSVSVTFNDGEQESFDLVIGADGIGSKTRRLAFDANEYTRVELGAYVSIFSAENIFQLNHSGLFFEKDKKSVYIASDHNPEEVLVGFMFTSNNCVDDYATRESQIAWLKSKFATFGHHAESLLSLLDKSEDLYFDSIAQMKMPTWSKHRVALVGDAGYCASPLSGQGTSLALVGAYILAGELKRAAGDFKQAFASYNQKMRSFVAPNQALGAWVSEFFLSENELSSVESEQRNQEIMKRLTEASLAINLPDYDGE